MEPLALLVDDDNHMLFFLEQVLRPSGLTLLKATDGEQALEILYENTPALILLDILLPKVSGMDVLDFIARTPRFNDTFVMVISSQSRSFFTKQVQLARANVYSTKPVSTKDIREAAQQVLVGMSKCL